MIRTMAVLAMIAIMQGPAPESAPAGSQQFIEYPPVLIQPDGGLPDPYPDSAKIVSRRVVLQFIVDTTGRVLPNSVQVLFAADSMSSKAAQAIVPSLRYIPDHLVEIAGPCARFNEGPLVCGGAKPRVTHVKHLAELSVQFQ